MEPEEIRDDLFHLTFDFLHSIDFITKRSFGDPKRMEWERITSGLPESLSKWNPM